MHNETNTSTGRLAWTGANQCVSAAKLAVRHGAYVRFPERLKAEAVSLPDRGLPAKP